MHCSQTDPPFILSATFLADGLEICEYEPTVKDRHVQCWVPVSTGQIISVNCKLQTAGIVHHVDFLVDGIIRDTWISKKNQQDASLVFDQAYVRQERNLVLGTMKTFNADRDPSKDSCSGTLGSIEIRVYRPDSLGSIHSNTSRNPDSTLSLMTVYDGSSNSAVPITHQIKFDGVHDLTPYQKSTFRAKLRESRPGTATWASLTFLYRSHESLQAAGFLHLSDGQTNGISPSPYLTKATTPASPKPSLNHQKISSAVNKKNNQVFEQPESNESVLSPKVGTLEPTTPMGFKNSAAQDSVPSSSIEFDIEHNVSANSTTVVGNSDRDISRNRTLSSSESPSLQPFTPATSALSLGTLPTRSENPQRRRSGSLFLMPHPEERRSQQTTDSSLWSTMALHQDESVPPKGQQTQHKGSKRAHVDIDDASPEPVSEPFDNNAQAILKRRKKDIDAMRVIVAEVEKKRDEAKRAREEARKKAEEHQERDPAQVESESRLTVYSESFKSSGPASKSYSRRWNVRLRKILWLRKHTCRNAKSLTKATKVTIR
ncbi:MAG: hypothetical protein FRX48_08669 [Lasallia pustulata]|uniref:Uncharacterized protein n=1 Tax=Lasallia pustulata TaxID=136370 RepID=A0A5M8PEM3_9LECA|nr:MAG: hypothetical protein FRX48_08669 [Lasallia pustulata]